MAIETALIAYLQGCSAVTALAKTLCYGLVPESDPSVDNYPAISIQMVGSTSDYVFEGYSGLTFCRLQVNAWARVPLVVLSLVDAIKKKPGTLAGAAGLNGFSGTWGTVQIGFCLKADEADLAEPPLAAPGLAAERVYGRMLEFKVAYNEETA
jgi:hypothetical protein